MPLRVVRQRVMVGTALGREATQVGGGLIRVAGIEDGGGGEGGGSKVGR